MDAMQRFIDTGDYLDDPAIKCAECARAGNWISGVHSHVCRICGDRAYWGWYTEPRCEVHRTLEQGSR